MAIYQIISTDKTTTVTIAPYTTDGPSFPDTTTLHENATQANSSLVLLGQGMSEYGDIIANNFYHILENFNNSSPPSYPVNGQLWFDTDYLNIRKDDTWTKIPIYNNDSTILSIDAKLTNVDTPTNNTDAPNVQYCLDNFLNLQGGTFQTGSTIDFNNSSLINVNYPVNPNDAANKQYVDDVYADGIVTLVNTHINDNTKHLTSSQNTLLDGLTVTHTEINRLSGVSSNVQTQLNRKLDTINGGTISGPVFLTYTPNSGNHLVNKSYVDDSILSSTTSLEPHVNDSTIHITPWQNTFLDGLADNLTSTEVNRLRGITSNVQNQIDKRLKKSGGTITGEVFSTFTPTDPQHIITKSYVDSKKYTQDFLIADWTFTTNYTITITNTEHQLGETKYLSVQVYEDGTPNSLVNPGITISDIGEIVITSNIAFDGFLIIT